MKGNIIGAVNTPSIARASGMWDLREQYIFTKATSWPGTTATDSYPASNVLTLKTINLSGATETFFTESTATNGVPTRSGDVTQGTFTPFMPTNLTGYWSCYFDGTNDYLTVPDNAALQLGTGSFTIEFWWNPNNVGQYQTPFDKGTSSAGGIVFQLGNGGAGILGIYMGGTRVIDANTVMVAGRWTHVALVRNGTALTLYFNGVSVASTTNSTNLNSTATVYIGQDWSSYTQGGSTASRLNGYLSNLRVVKGNAVYTSAFTPPTSPLTAIAGTSLLCLQDNRFKDNSTNNFTITKYNNATVARPSPFSKPRVFAGVNPAGGGSVYLPSSSSLTLPSSSAFTMGTGDWTIECWYRNDTGTWSGSNNYLVDLGANGTRIQFYSNQVYFNAGGGTSGIAASGVGFSYNTWHHIAMVRSGNTVNGYIDGSRVATFSYTGNMTDTGCSIGQYGGGGYNFPGYISNFRIVKGTAVYTGATYTVPTAPLTAISGTSLLTAQSPSTVTDASSNNFTVTKNGTARAAELYPFPIQRVNYTYSGSAYFDGNGDYLSFPYSSSAYDLPGAFTVEFWMHPTADPSGYAATMVSGGYTSNSGWEIQWRTSPQAIRLGFGDTALMDRDFLSSNYLNKWTHIAVTRDAAGDTRMFFDGVQQGAAVNISTSLTSSSAVFNIGYLSAATSQYYTGYLANLRVVKGSAVYTSNFTPPTTPVTAIAGTTLLMNFDNAGMYDSSGTSTIVPVGTVSTSSAATKYAGSSVYFNGSTSNYLKLANNIDLRGLKPFTYECWFRPDRVSGTNSYEGIMTTSVNSSTYPYFWLCQRNATLIWEVGTAAMSSWQVTNTPYGTLSAAAWHHIAICGDSTNLRLFLNGSQIASTTHPSWTSTAPLLIGALPGQSGCFGYIEDVRLSLVARYTSSFTPPTLPFA